MSNEPIKSKGFPLAVRPWVWRLLIFGGLWYLLTEGVLESWLVGIIAVPLAAGLSLGLSSGNMVPNVRQRSKFLGQWSVLGLLRFIPYFFYQSLRGGLDIARRALTPGVPLAPGFVEYELQRLSPGPLLTFFLNIISLIPGTVCVNYNGRSLLIHVINEGALNIRSLQECEQKIFAISKPQNSSTPPVMEDFR